MIYVIIFLLMLMLATILSPLFYPSYSKIIKPLSNTDSLTHDEILQLLDLFEYPQNDGVCHGFTLNWAQAVPDNNEDYFFNLLNTLKLKKSILQDKTKEISAKIKHHQLLSKGDNRISEVRALLGLICLAQDPVSYYEVYNKPLAQSNIDQILKLIRFQKTPEHNTAKCVYRQTLPFISKEKLKEYLQQLRLLLKVEDKIAIVAGSEEHSLGFRVHPKGWLFLDINNLYKQSKQYPQQILSTDQLAKTLYETLFEKGNHFILSSCFIGHPNASLMQRLKKLDLMFPLTKKNRAITNSRGYSVLPLATQANDKRTVRELLAWDAHGTFLEQEQLNFTLYYAAANNHVGIIKMLCRKPNIDLNRPCDSKNNSMLGLACREGHTEAVLALLQDPRVQIHYVNKKGQTPLMIACASPYTVNNRELFKALIEAGATLSTPEGTSMLDFAKLNDNQAAIDIITSLQPREKPKPSFWQKAFGFSTSVPTQPDHKATSNNHLMA